MPKKTRALPGRAAWTGTGLPTTIRFEPFMALASICAIAEAAEKKLLASTPSSEAGKDETAGRRERGEGVQAT